MKNWKNWAMVILGVLVVVMAMLFIDAQYLRHSKWEQGYQELLQQNQIKDREYKDLQATLLKKQFEVENAAKQSDDSGVNYWKKQFNDQKVIAENRQKKISELNKKIKSLEKQLKDLGVTPVTEQK